MKSSLEKILRGYQQFRNKYAVGDHSIMQYLSSNGQQPAIMVIACCDSRVDPALILQCDPGDLFVVRNVANIVPPYEKDEAHHGTSAALEFGVRALKVKHLILLGHSQCGGIQALLNQNSLVNDDFVSNWVSLIKTPAISSLPSSLSVDDCAKTALQQSHQNCLSFPWIVERVAQNLLQIHLWFFDIKTGQIFAFNEEEQKYLPL